MGTILIEGLEVYAFHGYFDEEQKIGGKYIIDIELVTDFKEAVEKDELSGTVNYADIVEVVEEEMKIKSKLIEHVAGRIINTIIDNYKSVEWIRIKLQKINPPIGTKLGSVGVVLEKDRKVV